jgi:K+-transporting ATPase ATPase B chain
MNMQKEIIKDSLIQSVKKLSFFQQVKNPVMFIVYLGAIFSTVLSVLAFFTIQDEKTWYIITITLILWFTLLFANFAESIAEGRGRAQADSLRKSKKDVMAKVIPSKEEKDKITLCPSNELKIGDICIVEANEVIPMDGEVIEGVASVDESAITGESAPVVRESGGDRSAVTGGTLVVSDYIVVEISAVAGESFMDKMISMVEGASRKKTPNEIALQMLLITLTIIFVVVSATLLFFSTFASDLMHSGKPITLTNVIALLVCLSPTTIGALLSSIGIAGMSRLNQANILAMSGRAIEAAGDVDILLLDKTGTITLGNRQASEFVAVRGVDQKELVHTARISSLSDETAEGRSIVALANTQYTFEDNLPSDTEYIEFSAKTRMSGVDYNGISIRKGSADAIKKYVLEHQAIYPQECDDIVTRIAQQGGTPLVVIKNLKVLGVVNLKDIVKQGMRENFEDLRKSGIKTIMITGDNSMTAAAIAAEAGVDEFVAEATPETKLNIIKSYQMKGHLVAMTGDGTNDAPALAQADVAVAMNSGTQAAKEAGNMVDLDSNPTKLIEVVRIGKQLLMTRGALTTFSIANDIAKYFAIIPVLFVAIFPQLEQLNFMQFSSSTSAILSAIIYNAVIIIALIPLSLKGVTYKERSAEKQLRYNLLIYGLGGVLIPFLALKVIDICVTILGIG